jgi:hypothetical protein
MDKGKVLFAGNTDDALAQLRGKVWEKRIEKSELEQVQQDQKVISTKLVGGKPLVHVFAHENPSNGFVAAEENLEDVFFSKLNELI